MDDAVCNSRWILFKSYITGITATNRYSGESQSILTPEHQCLLHLSVRLKQKKKPKKEIFKKTYEAQPNHNVEDFQRSPSVWAQWSELQGNLWPHNRINYWQLYKVIQGDHVLRKKICRQKDYSQKTPGSTLQCFSHVAEPDLHTLRFMLITDVCQNINVLPCVTNSNRFSKITNKP